jgi:hypothetical protein
MTMTPTTMLNLSGDKAKLTAKPPMFNRTKNRYDTWKCKVALYLIAYKKDFTDN